MPPLERCVIDTNVLVYAHLVPSRSAFPSDAEFEDNNSKHLESKNLIERAGELGIELPSFSR